MINQSIKLLFAFLLSYSGTITGISKNENSVVLTRYYEVGGCGNIAFAAAYTFMLENKDSVIIGIIRCPDTYGKNFFKEGRKYRIQITNAGINDSLKNYALTNPFEKNTYPVFSYRNKKTIKE